jgi:hypothetical protein
VESNLFIFSLEQGWEYLSLFFHRKSFLYKFLFLSHWSLNKHMHTNRKQYTNNTTILLQYINSDTITLVRVFRLQICKGIEAFGVHRSYLRLAPTFSVMFFLFSQCFCIFYTPTNFYVLFVLSYNVAKFMCLS